MTRRPLPAILLGIAALAGACSHPAPATSIPDSPAANATTAPLLPTTVNSLPLTSVDGYHQLLDQLRGTPVVVTVWGSWCEPCRLDAPLLAAAARAHPDVQFVGVDVGDSRDGAVAFIHEFGTPYPSLFDPMKAIGATLYTEGPPVTVFFDASGTKVSEIQGPVTAATLDNELAKISG